MLPSLLVIILAALYIAARSWWILRQVTPRREWPIAPYTYGDHLGYYDGWPGDK